MAKPSTEQKLEIARLSFIEKKNNKQIAAILRPGKAITNKTNISWVQEWIDEAGAWLLDEHRRLQEIENADSPERRLARELCEKYPGLMDARVVPGGEPTAKGYAPLDEHAKAAAVYFDEKVAAAEKREEQLHVAVTGGQTILDIVNSLPERRRSNVTFYATSLIGRGKAAQEVAHVGPEANATIAWARSGNIPKHLCYGTVKPYYINQDGLHGNSPEERHRLVVAMLSNQRDQLLRSSGVQEFLDDMNPKINFVIGGLGLLQPTAEEIGGKFTERISMNWLLKELGIDLGILGRAGCVGDMCYAMFDGDGKKHNEWQFFITVGDGSAHEGVDFYRNLVTRKKVPVMVVAGARKEEVVRLAMKAELFNVLVTDAYTAKRLLASK